jgi:hypothetical protein
MPKLKSSQKGTWRRRIRFRYPVLLAVLGLFVHIASGEVARSAARQFAAHKLPQVLAGPRLISPPVEFQATAYCDSGITKSGIPTSVGIVAADPKVLPIGSVINVEVPGYPGVYQVMDTGRLEFGRQKVKVTVLRYGFFHQSSRAHDPVSSPE